MQLQCIQPDVSRTWQTEGDCYQQTLNIAQIRQAVWNDIDLKKGTLPHSVSERIAADGRLIYALHLTFYIVRCVEAKNHQHMC